MGICYPDTEEPFTGRPVRFENQDACKHYLIHFGNSLYLTAIIQRPRDPMEKRQALKELAKAEKKMEHWRRHPNWCAGRVAEECKKLRDEWEGSGIRR